jgi:putative phosphoesterase
VTRIGLVSDTHGLVRPQALELLKGSDRIIHAGDICDPEVLRQLARIAPVTAVRGNNDRGDWAAVLRESEVLQAEDALIYVIHDLAELDIDPAAAGMQVVVSGHSHKPKSQLKEGVLCVNPGSAGPRRFRLPVSVGRLVVKGASVEAELLEIAP